jgi:predicted nucleotidyltransferase
MFPCRKQNVYRSETKPYTVLSGLFRTEERVRILRYVLYHSPCTVMEVAAATGTSKGHVSRFLPFLVSHGLLAREGRRFHWTDGPLTRSVKVLLNLEHLLPAVPLPGWAEGIGVYGSWAEGTNTDESDLDLWVLAAGYPGDVKVGELTARITGAVGTEIHLLFLTGQKLADLRTGDETFYTSLMRTSLLLRGQGLGHP